MRLSIITLFLSIFLICCSRSCENPLGVTVAYTFHIQNNTNHLVFYLVNKMYPDTAIQDSLQMGGIASSKQKSYESRKTWPQFFESLPADTLSIFFFSPDTVDKYGWKQVQSKYLILERKDISLKDLETNNYIVTYP